MEREPRLPPRTYPYGHKVRDDSALEAKRCLSRFALGNRIDCLEGILHCKRNEYDSIINPLTAWLEGKGVHSEGGCAVYDVELDDGCNTAEAICMRRESKEERIAVRPCDLVFVTNGSLMTNASFGDNEHVARLDEDTDDLGLFTVWQNLAARDAKFGHPEKFLGQIGKTKWMSCFITMKDYPEFFGRVERMMGSPAGTGGVVTLRDSGWEMSLMFYDRDCFPHQRENNEDVLWGDGLFGERLGTYIRKPMGECTGNEILLELLCHLDMLDMKDEVLAHAHVSTCMIPCIMSQFMPRTAADRPRVVPEGCTNVAFIGQHVEVPGDVVFTIETSIRTPLEAACQLCGIEKDPIEVYPSQYDMRYALERFKKFSAIEGPITEGDLPKMNPLKLKAAKQRLISHLNEIPPCYVMYPGRDQSVATKASVSGPGYPKDGEQARRGLRGAPEPSWRPCARSRPASRQGPE